MTGIGGPGVSASFVYDGVGRREKKTINSSLTEFLFDSVNPVQETSGATVMANILTGLGIDEFFTRTDLVAGTTSNLIPDGLGSTIALADSAGAVQTEYSYEPFGRTTATGASNSNPFQYTGRENDGTGLYYYRARYYHPALQRFISEDPIEFYGGDVNLYAYISNTPSNLNDPFGRCPICLAAPLAGPAAVALGDAAVAAAGGVLVAGIGGWVWNNVINNDNSTDTFPDPGNPPSDWVPHPDGKPDTYKDPAGDTWRWHPDPEGKHGGDHWDIGGPKPGPGQKGKQDE